MSMFGFFPQPSDEEQARMREAWERDRMSLEEFNHSFQRLFNELDQDQLTTLKNMLGIAAQHTVNTPMVAQWAGMAEMALSNRFGICITCGVDHSKELQVPETDTGGNESKSEILEQPGATPDKTDIPDDLEPLSLEEQQEVLQGTGPYELTQRDKELMYLYHLDDLRDADTNELLGFICTGIEGMKGPCGKQYVSIKDRMLRSPDHCDGCFQRMAQG